MAVWRDEKERAMQKAGRDEKREREREQLMGDWVQEREHKCYACKVTCEWYTFEIAFTHHFIFPIMPQVVSSPYLRCFHLMCYSFHIFRKSSVVAVRCCWFVFGFSLFPCRFFFHMTRCTPSTTKNFNSIVNARVDTRNYYRSRSGKRAKLCFGSIIYPVGQSWATKHNYDFYLIVMRVMSFIWTNPFAFLTIK